MMPMSWKCNKHNYSKIPYFPFSLERKFFCETSVKVESFPRGVLVGGREISEYLLFAGRIDAIEAICKSMWGIQGIFADEFSVREGCGKEARKDNFSSNSKFL